MVATVAGIHLGIDTHANRPAANTVPDGSQYSCSTHSLIYKSNFGGNSWATWATLGTAASGSITASGYTQTTARLLGRTTASTGAIEEITVGSGLSLSAGALTATGGSSDLGGKELDYVQITSPVTVSGTSETSAGSTLVITGNSVAYDGSTVADIEFFSPGCAPLGDAAGRDIRIAVYESTTMLGRIAYLQTTVAGSQDPYVPVCAHFRLTPSNASHTYLIRASRTGANGTIQAGAGGSATYVPAFMRITRVTS